MLIQTYSIKDRTFYDASSSDHLSKYSITTGNGTITYDSTNQAYYIKPTANNGVQASLSTPTFSNNIIIECDVRIAMTSDNSQAGIRLQNNRCNIVYTPSGKWADHNGTNTNFSVTTAWYHIKMTISNGQSVLVVTQGDTTVVTSTKTIDGSVSSTGNILKLYGAYSANTGAYIKNISVQEL